MPHSHIRLRPFGPHESTLMTITQISTRRPSATTSQSAPEAAPARTLQAVPDRTEARGFALYIGLDEVHAAQSGISLARLVAALKQAAAELVPDVQAHATVALAPRGAGGRDVDVVRLALHDPAAVQRRERERHEAKVVVDLTRQRVRVSGRAIGLTDKEFRLLTYLIEHEGETVPREQLLTTLWADEEVQPSVRTIDVHIRRLRAKLGEYQDIIHTVRGAGYRFDRHADVLVQQAA